MTIQYLIALYYLYSVYVRYSEIIWRCAHAILLVRLVLFVALHIVLDHLVSQFSNNEKSQVNMGYRDDIFFIYSTESCINTAERLLYMCTTCIALSRLCICPQNIDVTFTLLKTTSDISKMWYQRTNLFNDIRLFLWGRNWILNTLNLFNTSINILWGFSTMFLIACLLIVSLCNVYLPWNISYGSQNCITQDIFRNTCEFPNTFHNIQTYYKTVYCRFYMYNNKI
jgi:hypothetical protein